MKLKSRIPQLLGNLIFLVGFFNVAANIIRPFRHAVKRIDSYTLVYVNSTAFSTSLISGLLLILISRGIRKRKKRAWNLSVILLAISVSVEAFRYHVHFEHVIINLSMLALLILFRNEFYAKSDPAGGRHPIISLLVSGATFVIIGVLLLLFRHHGSLVGNPSFIKILQTCIKFNTSF